MGYIRLFIAVVTVIIIVIVFIIICNRASISFGRQLVMVRGATG